MKRILYITTLVFCITTSYSQNDGAGNTGLSFLKMGITSRSISMGEAVVSNSWDASATFYNPAAMFNGRDVNLQFMHNSNVLGIRSDFFGAKVKMSKLALGFHFINTAVNDIEVREIPGAPLDKFNAQDISFGLSLGYKVNENLQIGATGKFLYEKIYIDNASGFALDLGGVYSKDKISLGFAISNIGSISELRTVSTKLPTSIRGGASYFVEMPKIQGGLRINADGYKVMDGGKFHLHTGAEFTYKDFLAIRAGYMSGYENKNLTTGLGLKYKAFSLDYAFVPYKFSQGSSHTFTIGTSF